MREFVELMATAFVLAAAGNFISIWEDYRVFPGRVVRAQKESLPIISVRGARHICTDENLEIEMIEKSKEGKLLRFVGYLGWYPSNKFEPV